MLSSWLLLSRSQTWAGHHLVHFKLQTINQFYFLYSESVILMFLSVKTSFTVTFVQRVNPPSTLLFPFEPWLVWSHSVWIRKLWAAEHATLPKWSYNGIHPTTGPHSHCSFLSGFGADVASSSTNLHYWNKMQSAYFRCFKLLNQSPSVRAGALLLVSITLMNKSYTIPIMYISVL